MKLYCFHLLTIHTYIYSLELVKVKLSSKGLQIYSCERRPVNSYFLSSFKNVLLTCKENA